MAKFDVNEDMVRKLAELLNETGLTEIEYKVGEHGIRVSRNSTGGAAGPRQPSAHL